ncbi:DUF2892 domain-containing protein [Leptospira biflexa]|nr:DUF2892 domain-containing protein [Leptospira biflexa]ABZ93357.1 Conserved hypothetical protein [Leptospira biflexa serovar Patoc strain 'Patoc 1 (Ames)']TGM38244.1 DUF2892 domain-containing protein [Leptospira biflexa]TGM41576.1 DUF2892 domain-containing protein [Leptospira biflexa]TGM47776.1 DUF2892 domain-containing protein [Leptospira biflexa]TGM49758.1 DUF2892 domain-containing protein [Leptospira biflexa]
MFLASTKTWYLERLVFLIAGIFSLVGVTLGAYVSSWWFLLNLLVGINLVVFSTFGFCPMAILLNKLGATPKVRD